MKNREIKFRAWSEFNGVKRMIYSGQPKENYKVTPFGILAYDKHNYQYTSYTLFGDDYPIMQYTGLKDKNGKEIYEGDIILAIGVTFKVGFRNGSFSAEYSDNEKDCYYLGNADESRFEIIGNLYQTPELL